MKITRPNRKGQERYKVLMLFIIYFTTAFNFTYGQSVSNQNASSVFQFYEQFGEINETQIDEGSVENRVLRSERIWMPRLYPHGNFSIAAEAIYNYASNYLPNVLEAEWEELGPIGISGYQPMGGGVGQIHCIEFHPDYNSSSNKKIFAGSNFGGL